MAMTEDYFRQVFPDIEQINDERLRKQVLLSWVKAVELGGWKSIDHIPFTLYYPTEINLVAHINQVTKMAIAIAKYVTLTSASPINLDTLIAGALLHDIGKLLEYSESENGITFRPGALRHHFSGVGLANEQGIADDVLNCIAYHGSEVNPKNRIQESIIIHHCDFICFEIEQKRAPKNVPDNY